MRLNYRTAIIETCVYIYLWVEKICRVRLEEKNHRTTEFQRETIDLVQSFNLHENKLGPNRKKSISKNIGLIIGKH